MREAAFGGHPHQSASLTASPSREKPLEEGDKRMAQNNKSYRELMELQGAGAGKAATSNQMLDLILNRKPAQYNAATDPAAQAARKR